MKPQVVILAAGESSRFFPFNLQHKTSLNLCGKPILIHTLESVVRAGIEEAIIVTRGNASEDAQIKTHAPEGIKITLVSQPTPQGQGEALLLAQPHIRGDFFILNANHYMFDQEISGWLERFKDPDLFGIGLRAQTNQPWEYGILSLDGDRILDLVEKPRPGSQPSNWKISVVYLVRQEFLSILESIEQTHYSLETAIGLAAQKHNFIALTSSGESPSLKYPWNLFSFKDNLLSQMEDYRSPDAMIAPTAVINGPVYIEAGAQIHDFALIQGPAYIGKNAVVGNYCLVRNHTILETGAQIERYCDVRNSIIGPGTHIHSQFVGDSIIGANCRIGAGFVTANKRLDRAEVKVQVKNEYISTQQPNLGTLIGDNVKIGVNVATMPGTVIGANSLVGPGITIRGWWDKESRITRSNLES